MNQSRSPAVGRDVPLWGAFRVFSGDRKLMTILTRTADTEQTIKHYAVSQLGLPKSITVEKI